MSRKETDEELNVRLEKEMAVLCMRRECDHCHCQPIEWYWSGQIQTMECNECGEREWREES